MSTHARLSELGPWAMKADRVVNLVSGMLANEDPASLAGAFEPFAARRVGGGKIAREASEHGYAMRGSVAVVPVGGVLTKNPSALEDYWGVSFGSTYTEIARGVGNAVEAWRAGRVGSILLLGDSPGGQVSGVSLAVDAVRRARAEGVHVEAFGDGLVASAAYWVLSQASHFAADRLCAVGSIGVYATLFDSSAMYENEGVKVHLVRAGDYKGIGTAGVPISDAERATVQSEIDSLYGVFVGDVAAGRGFGEDRARELGDGRVHIGSGGVSLGLFNRLDALDSVLERLNAKHGPKKRGGSKAAHTGGLTVEPNTNTTGGAPGAVETPAEPVAGGLDAAAIARIAGDAATAAIEARDKKTGEVNAARLAEVGAVLDGLAHVPGIDTLRAKATAPGSTMTGTEVAVEAANLAAKAAQPVGLIEVGEGGRPRMLECASAMLVERAVPGLSAKMRAGGDGAKRIANALDLEKPEEFAAQVREAEAGGLRRHSLKTLAELMMDPSVRSRGIRSDDDLYRASVSHGTGDFTNLLESTAQRTLLAMFAEQMPSYEAFASISNLRDFRQAELVRMSELPDLKLIPPGKSAEEGTWGERSEPIKLDTFGRKFTLSRQMFINDDLGAFLKLPMQWGMIANRVPEDLAYKVLLSNPTMSDGKTLFHEDHKNIGDAATLGVTSLSAARATMRKQRGFGKGGADGNGAYLDLHPSVLIVPVALQGKAETINDSEFDPMGYALAADSTGGQKAIEGPGWKANVERNRWKVVANPRIDDVSETMWIVASDPGAYRLVEVGFLDGRREPIISRLSDGSALGEGFEIIFDCAAAAVDHEAGVMNAGA